MIREVNCLRVHNGLLESLHLPFVILGPSGLIPVESLLGHVIQSGSQMGEIGHMVPEVLRRTQETLHLLLVSRHWKTDVFQRRMWELKSRRT